jgi:phosphatidylglycerol:prolipoprotein diacylglycerol transferase
MLRLLWNIDPVLLHLGPLELRWYGLLFAGGILAAYQVGIWSFERAGGSREETNRLLGYVIVGTVVGARLGHCLLYEPAYYLRHPLEILAVWRGGLASHGGAVGIVLAVWLFARRTGRDLLWLLDRVAVAAPVAAACIRVGNFFNSEIVGRPSGVPWAVVFVRLDPLPRHPAMLYEAAALPGDLRGDALAGAAYRAWRTTGCSHGHPPRSDLWLALRHRVPQGTPGGV